MEQRFYRFAGLEFAVALPDGIQLLADDVLKPFRTETVDAPHTFRVRLVDRLPLPVGECLHKAPNLWVCKDGDRLLRYRGSVSETMDYALMRVEYRDRTHEVLLRDVACRDGVSAKSLLEAMAAEHLVVRGGGVLFHCSYIDVGGKAVLFTAPSQTGKSTQADLWHRYRGAEIVNGDRAAIRICGGQILAEGIPFSGSSPHCKNRSLPLMAIVYLAQAPVTSVRRLTGFAAFARIWEGVSVNTWDKTDMELASETVRTVAAAVPVFHMPCTPDACAVEALEGELKKLVSL